MGKDVRSKEARGRDWFPFSLMECEISLALLGALATVLSLLGIPGNSVVMMLGGLALSAYLAGLLVYARRSSASVRFLPDGAVEGMGYLASFREARSSLFLVHLDDDTPNPELLRLYATLLERGVQIRRLIVVRDTAHPNSLHWINEQPRHQGLVQRALRVSESDYQRLSFAIVDEETTLLAIPGVDAIDSASYSDGFLLRHLIAFDHEPIARALLGVHRELWSAAKPLP